MKKIIVLLLCFMLVFLCACAPSGGGADISDNQSESSSEEGKDYKKLAESCIDKSVEELYQLIGKPESSDYAKSCMGAGDDGNLYYDGFTVYTYREGDEETVIYVE